MKHIGMVSKEAHAKSHAAAIRQMGHQVTMLGGSPKSIPPSIDVVICRPASVSHNGYNCTMAWKRKGGEAIFTNSLDAMVKALKSEGQGALPQTEFFRSQDVVMYLSDALGVYGPHLHDEQSRDIVIALAANRSGSTEEADNIIRSWEGARQCISRDAIRAHCKKMMDKRAASFRKLYSRRLRGGVRTYGFAVVDEEALATFISRSELTASRPSAHRGKKKKTPVPMPRVKPAPVVESKSTEADPYDAQGVPMAAVKPVKQVNPAMADLHSALEMLGAEMEALSIAEITVQSDGSYRFRRVVVTDHSGKVEKTW